MLTDRRFKFQTIIPCRALYVFQSSDKWKKEKPGIEIVVVAR